jgi:hypothetical protein
VCVRIVEFLLQFSLLIKKFRMISLGLGFSDFIRNL